MSKSDHDIHPYHVLFVCTGNTCRSAMAEGILRTILTERDGDIPAITVSSAGTGALRGAPATRPSREIASQNGVDIAGHKAQTAGGKLLQEADLILALAADHVDYLISQGVPPEKVFLLRAFPERPANWQDLSVFDPIGQSDDFYREVFFQIDEAIHQALPEIIARAKTKAESQSS